MHGRAVPAIHRDSASGDKPLLLPLPNLIYTPETRFGGGVYSLYFFRFQRSDTISKPSIIDQSTIYTQNRQFYIEPTWKIYTSHERFAFIGDGLFQYYTEKFFGVGNYSPLSKQETYASDLLRVDTKLQAQLVHEDFIGLHYLLEDMYNISSRNQEGEIAMGHVIGARGGLANGAGLAFTHDSRSSITYPLKGNYLDIENAWFSRSLGSRYSFSTLTVDGRKFIEIFPDDVLAFQVVLKHVEGAAPFRMLALLGGPQIMRGYYLGRFRDNNSMASQVEGRFPFDIKIPFLKEKQRMIATAFICAGEVSHTMDQFNMVGVKPNYGGGLRYVYNKRKKLDFRLDIGFGQGNAGVYVSGGEAF